MTQCFQLAAPSFSKMFTKSLNDIRRSLLHKSVLLSHRFYLKKKNKNKKHAENKFDSDTAQNLIEVHHITQHKHRPHCSLICCSQVKHVHGLSQTKRKACVNTGEHWGNTGTDSLFLSLLCHFQQRREGLHSRWLLGSPKSNDGKDKYD